MVEYQTFYVLKERNIVYQIKEKVLPIQTVMSNYEVILDNDKMDKKIIEQIDKQGDKQNHKTNIKANMTDWDMRKKPGFKELVKITDMVLKDVQNLRWPNSDAGRKKLKLKNIWGAKYKSGEETAEHDHWPALWSFVYYPNKVEGASGLTFREANVERTIERGLLLFFSGNIQHSVRPSEFEGYRYCVAGNYHDTN